jgi:hypothetical protein
VGWNHFNSVKDHRRAAFYLLGCNAVSPVERQPTFRATLCYILEDITLHNHLCENLKPHIWYWTSGFQKNNRGIRWIPARLIVFQFRYLSKSVQGSLPVCSVTKLRVARLSMPVHIFNILCTLRNANGFFRNNTTVLKNTNMRACRPCLCDCFIAHRHKADPSTFTWFI